MDINEIISNMTLEEKASFFSGKNFWETMDAPKYGIKSMCLSDGPNGLRKQAVGADHLGYNESIKSTCFPSLSALSNSFDKSLAKKTGEYIGREAVSMNVNVLLAPGVNIKRNPLCGRNFEYFSEDPYLSGKMAAGYVQGVQSNGIAACVKHFAVNNQEERRLVSNSVVDVRTLREIYLTAFEIVIKEGKSRTIMSAYNLINGVYANENEFLLKKILRDEWGFNGVVVSDWGGNNNRVEALKVGSELEMPTTDGETNGEIVEAVRNGLLDERYVDDALYRLLTLAEDTQKIREGESKPFNELEHHLFAKKVAEESLVLLKNDGVLPLRRNEKIAVIGDFAFNPRYQGDGSSRVNPTRLDNTVEIIGKYPLAVVGCKRGFHRYGKKRGRMSAAAVKTAKNADTVVLYLGLDEITEAEGLDRKEMRLPQNQIDLLLRLRQLGKKIVVVLSAGSPIEMPWLDSCDALIHTYLAGQAGAEAIVEALVGEINPSGRLSESYPFTYEDCPSSAYFPGKELSVEYREGPFVGYRYYETAGVETLFPFGYGLSYTDFKYENITVSERGVRLLLTNIGKFDGAEVVQMYVGAINSNAIRAAKELKGFEKVFLKAGESAEVFLPFDEYTFRYYNEKRCRWETEPVEYSIMIGANCRDIRLTAVHRPQTSDSPYDRLIAVDSYYDANIKHVLTNEFENLLGSKVPASNRKFIKKNRINVDYNTTVTELRYARGFFGRMFAWAIRSGYALLRMIGKKKTANILAMGMFHQPMRCIARMSGGIISMGQLDGLILIFNGRFFKGLKKFMRERKIKKARHAERRKAESTQTR